MIAFAPWEGSPEPDQGRSRVGSGSGEPSHGVKATAQDFLNTTQRERLQRAAALLADLQQRKNRLPLAALVQELLDRTGLPAVLAGQFGGRQLVSNVRKLVALAGEFEAGRQTQGQGSLRDFIEHLKRMTTEEVREGQAPVEEEAGDSIKLITYHSAKGLQWPIVVVPDLCRRPGGGFGAPYRWHRDLGLVAKTTRLQQGSEDTGYWPPPGRALKTRNDAEEEAESRRLFYVAATRAQDLLLLSGVTQLTQQGAVLSEAQQGPLGWLNEALGDPLWAEGGNAPGERCWRWAGHGLEECQEAVTSAEPWQRPGPAPATAAPDLDRLRAQLAPIALADRGQWRFTATELSLYSHCPRLYELEVRLGLPGVTPAFTAQAEAGKLSPLELGTVVHRVLQLVGSGGRAALDEWVPEGATMLRLDTKLDKRAVAAIPRIRRQVLEFVASPLYTELFGGDTHLRSEALIAARLTVDGQPVIVEGKLDALVEDRVTGERHLLDYKTGELDVAKEAQYRVQLGLYCQAVQQATGSLPASARLLYLTRTGLKTVELDVPADTARAVEQAEAAITGLWRGEFPERAGQCDYCVGWRFCHPAAVEAEAGEEDG